MFNMFGAKPFGTPFAASTSFTQTATSGTTVKFNPPSGQDTIVKNGYTIYINTKHQCITAMKEYKNKSIEELRLEDYAANRKGKQQQAGGSLFGTTPTTTATGFNFGGADSGTGFGASAGFGTSTGTSLFGQQQSTGLFGQQNKTAFGTITAANTGLGFGTNTSTETSLFGQQQKPGGLFGTNPVTTQSSLFGTGTGTSFGSTSTFPPTVFGTSQQPSTGLFEQKIPAFGTSTAGSTGFSFNAGSSQESSNLFAKPLPNSTFTGFNTESTVTTGSGGNTSTFTAKTTGTSAVFATPGLGSNTVAPTGGIFGQNTSLSTATGLFRGGQQTTTLGGNQNTSFAFGSTPSSSGGLLGQNNQSTRVDLFATPVSNTTVGAKTPGFSGGNTSTFTAKTTGTSAVFATPGFGSNTPAPTGGIFGQNTRLSTATGLFRGGQQTTTLGGNQNTSFAFGSTPSASGVLLGQNNQSTRVDLFATPVSNTTVGAKTPGFSGTSAVFATPGLGSNTVAPTGGIFGQNTSLSTATGLFRGGQQTTTLGGNQNTSFAFGSTPSSSGGLLGQNNQSTRVDLFATPVSNTTVGAKTPGFSGGNTSTFTAKTTGTSAVFATPGLGSNTPAPTGGIFGQNTSLSTATGLFRGGQQTTTLGGNQNTSFAFGSTPSASGVLLGQNNQSTRVDLFATPVSNTTVGAKTPGFSGGNTSTFTAKTTGTSAVFATPGLGSNTPAPTGGIFGQNTSLSTATGLFRGGQQTTTLGGNQNTSFAFGSTPSASGVLLGQNNQSTRVDLFATPVSNTTVGAKTPGFSGGNTSTFTAKTTGTSAVFATPGLGSNTPAPTGGIFGQNTSLSTATGLFRGGQQTTTLGGNQNTSFAFGSTPSASGVLLGQNNQSTRVDLFATPVSNTTVGAKTPGFSGGNTSTFTAKTTGTSAVFATPGLGSNTPAPTGGIFGQNTSLSTATGLFRGGQQTTTLGGNQNTSFAFGSTPSASGVLLGQNNQSTRVDLFATPVSNTTVGAKTPGFSGGNTSTFTAKTTGTSAVFATPGLGSNTPAPTGGIFGQNTSLSTATGLFRGGQQTTTLGGNQNTSFAFGSTPSASGVLLGQNNQSTRVDLFATPVSNTTVGAKTPGFSGGNTSTFTAKTTGTSAVFATPGLGSNTPAPTGGIFGQNTSLSTATGLFRGGQQTTTLGGNQNTSFAFGSTPSASGVLLGQNNQSTRVDLFATPVSNTTVGAKTPGFSGGNTSTFTAKTTGTSAVFATPGLGSNTVAPTGGIFGQNTSLSTATGLFRGGQQTTTLGGNQNTSFAFGSTPSSSGVLLGQNNQSTRVDLFATPVSNTTVGAKTPGFSGGNTSTFTAKTTGTSAVFATPGFGSNTVAPTGGIFGQNTSLSTATGLFRGGQQTTTLGGNQNTSFAFGSNPSSSGGLLGQNNQSTGVDLFATPVSNTTVGAKTPGFSGGNTSTFTAKTTGTSAVFATPGFGSNTVAPTGGILGQNTSLSTATGLFGGGQQTTTLGRNQNTRFESTTKEIKPKCMDVGSQTDFGKSTVTESKPKCMDAGTQTDFGYFARELIDQFKSKENPDPIQDKGHTNMIFSGIPSVDGTLHPSIIKNKQLIMPRPSSFEAYEVCTHSFASLSVMPNNSSKDSQGTENTANVVNITAEQFGSQTLVAFPKATTQDGVAAGTIPSFTPTVTTQWIFSKTGTSSVLSTTLGGLPAATSSPSGDTTTNLSRLSIFGSLPITTGPGGLPTATASPSGGTITNLSRLSIFGSLPITTAPGGLPTAIASPSGGTITNLSRLSIFGSLPITTAPGGLPTNTSVLQKKKIRKAVRKIRR